MKDWRLTFLPRHLVGNLVLSPSLSLGASLSEPIGQPTTSAFTNARLSAAYQLWDTRGSTSAVRVGLGYEQLAYQDKQPLPDKLFAEITSGLLVGFVARF